MQILKRRRSRLVCWALLIVCLSACDPWFAYSPYESQLDVAYHGTTAKHLEKLEALDTEDRKSFKIAILADPQYHFGKLEDVIDHINAEGSYAFAIIAGDLTENGLKQEFVFFHQLMSQLAIPYVTVIGNHDYLSNGGLIYQQMYGPYNYSFVYNNVKFILWDNNTLESAKSPDFGWLAAELEDANKFDYVIPIAHIPPYDVQMKEHHLEYHELLLAHGITLSVHGHRHDFSVENVYGDDVRYLTASSPQKRTYSELTVSSMGLEVLKIEY